MSPEVREVITVIAICTGLAVGRELLVLLLILVGVYDPSEAQHWDEF
jgi:hypothetical protein